MTRRDPSPDPYVRVPLHAVRNPARQESKATVGSTQPQQRARAHVHSSSATQSIANATPTVVTFNVTDFDNVGLYTANKFTVPTTGLTTGTWLFHGHAIFAQGAGGTVRELTLRRDGTTTLAYSTVESNVLDALDVLLLINDPVPGSFYELVVNQDSGGALNLTTTAEKTFFECVHIW
ncbi:MAG: hypothetical protein L0Z53_06765 [Acidobacteriales bacterium]|nr:hypothetical protein [Terriglobales bacterium]